MELIPIIKRRLGQKVIGFGSDIKEQEIDHKDLLSKSFTRRFIKIWINS